MLNIDKIVSKIKKELLKEATSDSGGSRGSYISPLVPGFKEFEKTQLGPFTDSVSEYNDSLLAYDSYDGKMSYPKKTIKKLEKKSKKISNYLRNHPSLTGSDEDGNIINQTPGKGKKIVPINEWVEITDNIIYEADSSTTAGLYSGPAELGMKKWSKSELGPFEKFVNKKYNHRKVKSTTKNNVKRVVGMWEKGKDGTYDIDTHPVHTIKEDLGVWFGTKKKPKGSKQPKGPWVNICKKVDGKHPPCGRSQASDKSYPKCRAAGVAGKMTDSQKKSACAQKRKAEKTHSKTGTGNKPKMVSYKPRKK